MKTATAESHEMLKNSRLAETTEHLFLCFVGSCALQWLFILLYRQNPFHHNQMTIPLELF